VACGFHFENAAAEFCDMLGIVENATEFSLVCV